MLTTTLLHDHQPMVAVAKFESYLQPIAAHARHCDLQDAPTSLRCIDNNKAVFADLGAQASTPALRPRRAAPARCWR